MTLPESENLPEPLSDSLEDTQKPSGPESYQRQSVGDVSQSGKDNALNFVNATGNVEFDESRKFFVDRVIVNVLSPVDSQQFPLRPSQALSEEDSSFREVLVAKVQHDWIDTVLNNSLHNQALIELGLEERRNAVGSWQSGRDEFLNEPSRTFPKGTHAADYFNDLGSGRKLLLLGEPGAGKTITLLKLAESQLERMGNDLSQPIPVILNLSSWAKKRQPISRWLVQDLNEIYGIPTSQGKTWVDNEQLLLCLDGLDEVAGQYRNDCVKALNQFIHDHCRTEMVVCSRRKDYEALSERLRLRSAIYVQPLTLQQIDKYLQRAGKPLAALKTVLNHNAEIKAFATTPLILNVMSLAYQGLSPDEFPQFSGIETFRQQVFEAYVKRMFQRRSRTNLRYSNNQKTNHWLIWMAQRMTQTSQTIFLIERIQPTWLQTRKDILRYCLVSGLGVGLLSGLSASLLFWLMFWLLGFLKIGLDLGLWFGLSIVLGAGLDTTLLRDIQPVETLKWSVKTSNKTLFYWLMCGLFGGLGVSLFFCLVLKP